LPIPLVLEKNPPKQGLKQQGLGEYEKFQWVLEKNPPKQGLKREGKTRFFSKYAEF